MRDPAESINESVLARADRVWLPKKQVNVIQLVEHALFPEVVALSRLLDWEAIEWAICYAIVCAKTCFLGLNLFGTPRPAGPPAGSFIARVPQGTVIAFADGRGRESIAIQPPKPTGFRNFEAFF